MFRKTISNYCTEVANKVKKLFESPTLPNDSAMKELIEVIPHFTECQTQRQIWEAKVLADAWRRYYAIYRALLKTNPECAAQMRAKDLVGLARCSCYAETQYLLQFLPLNLRNAICSHKCFDIFSVEEFYIHRNQEIEVRGSRRYKLTWLKATEKQHETWTLNAQSSENSFDDLEETTGNSQRCNNDNNIADDDDKNDDDDDEVVENKIDENAISYLEVEKGQQTEWLIRLPPPSTEDLTFILNNIGSFASDGRGNIKQTLHRASVWRARSYYHEREHELQWRKHNYMHNRVRQCSALESCNEHNEVDVDSMLGVTIRVGKYVPNAAQALIPLIERGNVLILSRPGVGKTTLLRDLATTMANARAGMPKRVTIIDTSNEIAGDDDAPLPFMDRCRRMQVPCREEQESVMAEVIQNHTPEILVIDELSTQEEAEAALSMMQRGIRLIATCHASDLYTLVENRKLNVLVGGSTEVTLSSQEPKYKEKGRKTILERVYSSPFEFVVELRSRGVALVHKDVNEAVDMYLDGKSKNIIDMSCSQINDLTRPIPISEIDNLQQQKIIKITQKFFPAKEVKNVKESLNFSNTNLLTPKEFISSITTSSEHWKKCCKQNNNNKKNLTYENKEERKHVNMYVNKNNNISGDSSSNFSRNSSINYYDSADSINNDYNNILSERIDSVNTSWSNMSNCYVSNKGHETNKFMSDESIVDSDVDDDDDDDCKAEEKKLNCKDNNNNNDDGNRKSKKNTINSYYNNREVGKTTSLSKNSKNYNKTKYDCTLKQKTDKQLLDELSSFYESQEIGFSECKKVRKELKSN